MTSKKSLAEMPLNPKAIEDRRIASLLHMERSVKTPESCKLEERLQEDFFGLGSRHVTSERWRESITTVVLRNNVTEFSTASSLKIDTDELLSVREKEQRRLARRSFEKKFESDLAEIHPISEIPSAFKELWDTYSAKVAKILDERRERFAGLKNKQTLTDPPTPTEPQTREGDSSEPRQDAPVVLNESASQTADDLLSMPSLSSRDTASQTAAENVDSSETQELPTKQQAPTVAPENIPLSEDHAFRKPTPPNTRSTAKKAPRKDSKTDQAERLDPIPAGDGGSSKTSPSSTRRSPRLADQGESKPGADAKSDASKDPTPYKLRRRRQGSQSSDDDRSSSQDRAT